MIPGVVFVSVDVVVKVLVHVLTDTLIVVDTDMDTEVVVDHAIEVVVLLQDIGHAIPRPLASVHLNCCPLLAMSRLEVVVPMGAVYGAGAAGWAGTAGGFEGPCTIIGMPCRY